jgi:hypothetical protein
MDKILPTTHQPLSQGTTQQEVRVIQHQVVVHRATHREVVHRATHREVVPLVTHKQEALQDIPRLVVHRGTSKLVHQVTQDKHQARHQARLHLLGMGVMDKASQELRHQHQGVCIMLEMLLQDIT